MVVCEQNSGTRKNRDTAYVSKDVKKRTVEVIIAVWTRQKWRSDSLICHAIILNLWHFLHLTNFPLLKYIMNKSHGHSIMVSTSLFLCPRPSGKYVRHEAWPSGAAPAAFLHTSACILATNGVPHYPTSLWKGPSNYLMNVRTPLHSHQEWGTKPLEEDLCFWTSPALHSGHVNLLP